MGNGDARPGGQGVKLARPSLIRREEVEAQDQRLGGLAPADSRAASELPPTMADGVEIERKFLVERLPQDSTPTVRGRSSRATWRSPTTSK